MSSIAAGHRAGFPSNLNWPTVTTSIVARYFVVPAIIGGVALSFAIAATTEPAHFGHSHKTEAHSAATQQRLSLAW
jgi:hypothetical protein